VAIHVTAPDGSTSIFGPVGLIGHLDTSSTMAGTYRVILTATLTAGGQSRRDTRVLEVAVS
jgi:hypothetical protein